MNDLQINRAASPTRSELTPVAPSGTGQPCTARSASRSTWPSVPALLWGAAVVMSPTLAAAARPEPGRGLVVASGQPMVPHIPAGLQLSARVRDLLQDDSGSAPTVPDAPPVNSGDSESSRANYPQQVSGDFGR